MTDYEVGLGNISEWTQEDNVSSEIGNIVKPTLDAQIISKAESQET